MASSVEGSATLQSEGRYSLAFSKIPIRGWLPKSLGVDSSYAPGFLFARNRKQGGIDVQSSLTLPLSLFGFQWLVLEAQSVEAVSL